MSQITYLFLHFGDGFIGAIKYKRKINTFICLCVHKASCTDLMCGCHSLEIQENYEGINGL